MSLENQSTQKPVKFQAELLIKIIIAIIAGIALGLLLSLFSGGMVIAKILMIFNSIFSNFLSFVIPLLIIGLVAPGIGHLGKDAGKLLLITLVMAYAFTFFAGFSTYGAASLIYPYMLDGAVLSVNADTANTIKPYFTIDMPPVMSVTSALILAFVLGFGLAVTKTEKIMDVVDDLRVIINKIISSVIIPLLPFYILTIFMNITFVGEISKVLAVFLKIIILIFILTVILLLIFFSIAGLVAHKNPLTLLKKMMPAYITALGTSSSAATIPVTYESTLSNGVKTSYARLYVKDSSMFVGSNLYNRYGYIIFTVFYIYFNIGSCYGCSSRCSRWCYYDCPCTIISNSWLFSGSKCFNDSFIYSNG